MVSGESVSPVNGRVVYGFQSNSLLGVDVPNNVSLSLLFQEKKSSAFDISCEELVDMLLIVQSQLRTY
jgi:hypothetical protein